MDRLTALGQAFGVMTEKMYTDRMTIRRLTSTTGPTGGQIPGSPTVLASDVPCRTRPASANEAQLAGATQGTTALVVRFPAWQGSELIEFDARCEIEIAARPGGTADQILKVVAPLPNQGIYFEVVATMQS